MDGNVVTADIVITDRALITEVVKFMSTACQTTENGAGGKGNAYLLIGIKKKGGGLKHVMKTEWQIV